CGRQDCAAGQKRAAADAAVIHVLANQSTLDGTSNDPGYLPGHGILPAETVRDLARSAKIKPLPVPEPGEAGGAMKPAAPTASAEAVDPREAAEPSGSSGPAEDPATEPAEAGDPASGGEPRYRPSVALSEFIRWRDLTCRFPGCDAPAERCDIDHTA
ncbi:DUF222 domain-containing protein, partial [Mycobacterium syngnathidarum]